MHAFDQIVGHDNIIQHMQHAYSMSKISHAYILEGDEGMGKKRLAGTYAKLLQCENPRDGKACHSCSSCKQFESSNHPDVIHITPTKKTGYGVNDIREQILQDIHIKPYKSQYKIYIIEKADTMTVQAQNSLLKTIEEPPSYGVFFLLATNTRRFLQTILSRTVTLVLKPIALDLIQAYMQETYALTAEESKLYSSFSRGNLGKAILLKESPTFLEQRERMYKVLDLFIKGRGYDIMEGVHILEESKDEIHDDLDILISLIRDVLYMEAVQNQAGLIHQDKVRAINQLAMQQKSDRLVGLVHNIYQFKNQLRLNVNYGLSLYVMLTGNHLKVS